MIDLDKFKSYDLEDTDGELINKKVVKIKFRLLRLFG